MRELRDRQQFKRYLYSTPALILLAVVAFLMARGAGAIMSKNHESADKLEELEKANVLLRDRHSTLEANIAKLNTDEGLIEEIRNKFNAVRRGEHLAVIVLDKPKATTTEPTVAERLKRGWSWVKSLWSLSQTDIMQK